ncbi:hypothetical protein LPJ61_003598 [Coemansia biformis]|uniref:Uncharacterized protein n=1 Tax=Coemansia biformis TaxID=1286918 RepID=A0A9W7YBV5_9FUNG|nr:hypothetical protein LPJ61_003598 [Coemansia biformis]
MLARRAAQVAARSGVASARSNSTAAAADGEYPGSSNYRPGKEGYAPGFPPPKGWSAAPAPKPAQLRARDLPTASAKQTHVPSSDLAANDAGRLYRQKLRELRYGYLKGHVEQQEKKRELDEMKRQQMRVLVREQKAKLLRERKEYEEKVKADPLSAENVMNAEGKTVLSNLEEAETGEVGYTLAPPRVSVLIPKQPNEERQQERGRNRQLVGHRQHEANVQTMMTLFHEASSFVHYGNINYKIMQFMDSVSFPNRSLSEMFELVHKSGGVVPPAEIGKRTDELRNTLQGTTGHHNKLGYDGLMEWLDKHPEDADGISHVAEKDTPSPSD